MVTFRVHAGLAAIAPAIVCLVLHSTAASAAGGFIVRPLCELPPACVWDHDQEICTTGGIIEPPASDDRCRHLLTQEACEAPPTLPPDVENCPLFYIPLGSR